MGAQIQKQWNKTESREEVKKNPKKGKLHARVNFDFAQTCLTVHRAAPVEFAHAPLRPSLSVAPVAPVAAQQVAAINRLRSLFSPVNQSVSNKME